MSARSPYFRLVSRSLALITHFEMRRGFGRHRAYDSGQSEVSAALQDRS